MTQLVIVIKGIDLDDIKSCLALRRTLGACVGITNWRKPEIGKPIVIDSVMRADAIFMEEPDTPTEKLVKKILTGQIPTGPITFSADENLAPKPFMERTKKPDPNFGLGADTL